MKRIASLILALVFILGISIPAASAANIYPQDAGDSSYRDDILAVYGYGGLNGLVSTDGKFYPDNNCTTREFATILANLFGTRYIMPSNYGTSAITQGTACDLMTEVSRSVGYRVTFNDVTRNATVKRGTACALLIILLGSDSRLLNRVIDNLGTAVPSSSWIAYPACGTRFSDVSGSSWYYTAVEWAVNNGITSGTSSTTFSPSNNVTVAQWFMFLWRANKSPSSRNSCPFGGVGTSDSFYTALCWAGEKGLVTNDRIDPFSTVATRADVVWSLWKLNGSPYSSKSINFKDVSSSSTYYNAVRWGVQQGIISGSNTMFSPLDPLNRGAAVTMFYRCYQNTSYPNTGTSVGSSDNWYYYNGEKFYTGVWYRYGTGWLFNGQWFENYGGGR